VDNWVDQVQVAWLFFCS